MKNNINRVQYKLNKYKTKLNNNTDKNKKEIYQQKYNQYITELKMVYADIMTNLDELGKSMNDTSTIITSGLLGIDEKSNNAVQQIKQLQKNCTPTSLSSTNTTKVKRGKFNAFIVAIVNALQSADNFASIVKQYKHQFDELSKLKRSDNKTEYFKFITDLSNKIKSIDEYTNYKNIINQNINLIPLDIRKDIKINLE